MLTGEAAKRAALKLKEALSGKALEELNGTEYYGEYLGKTDKMGSDVPNPVSHVAYGYATQVCVLNEDGTIKKMIGAHDVGKAVNPISVEGQIEGGIVMSMGYALTEQYEIKEGRPVSRYGTLGLFKADKVPEIESIIVEKPGVEPDTERSESGRSRPFRQHRQSWAHIINCRESFRRNFRSTIRRMKKRKKLQNRR